MHRLPLRTLVLGVAVAVALSGCGNRFESPAATVGRQRITQDDLERRLDLVLAVQPDLAAQVESRGGESRKKDLTRQILTLLMVQQVVQVYAANHHIAVAASDVNQQLSQFIQQSGGQAQLQKELAARGVTQTDLREALASSLLLNQVANTVAPAQQGSPTDQDTAFRTWLAGQLKNLGYEVNPRFGRLDVQRVQIVPITSTA